MTDYYYAAKCPHGDIRAAAVDEPKYAKDNAKMVAAWIRDGYVVERLEGSPNFGLCECMRKGKRKAKKQAEMFE